MHPEQIKGIREELGWTQKRLAEELGVSVRTVKHWEAGTRNISATAEKLLRLLSAYP